MSWNTVVKNVKRPSKNILTFVRLRWELIRAGPPHGMGVSGQHGVDWQDLPDLVLANLVCCHSCFKLSALLFLLCFPGLLLVQHLHLKLLPVFPGQTGASKILEMSNYRINKDKHLDSFWALQLKWNFWSQIKIPIKIRVRGEENRWKIQ